LNAVRDRLPTTPFLFNNVNDFPTSATARTGQSGTYIEVWEPHSTLQDLAQLAAAARAHRPEHPPILSAYLSCFEQDEAGAVHAAELVMATAFSSGASHLLLGEDGNALTLPYYPTNHRLSAEAAEVFVPWYDFQVRYGELLYDPSQVDVTESFTGGINGDLVFTGAAVSTKALPGHLWTRVVRTQHGFVVHLVDLSAQDDTSWDAVKRDPGTLADLEVAVSFLGAEGTIWFASVAEPDLVPLRSIGVARSDQGDALTAAQAGAAFAVPAFRTWAMLLIPVTEGA
jgi:dextranase